MVRMVIEYVLAAVFVVLAVITVTTPQWVEALFGIDPHRGSGALEWLIVATLRPPCRGGGRPGNQRCVGAPPVGARVGRERRRWWRRRLPSAALGRATIGL